MALVDHHNVPNAVVAALLRVEFENDVLRVVRIKYGLSDSSVMHSDEASCAIMITSGDFKMELPDGSVNEAPISGFPVQRHYFDTLRTH